MILIYNIEQLYFRDGKGQPHILTITTTKQTSVKYFIRNLRTAQQYRTLNRKK